MLSVVEGVRHVAAGVATQPEGAKVRDGWGGVGWGRVDQGVCQDSCWKLKRCSVGWSRWHMKGYSRKVLERCQHESACGARLASDACWGCDIPCSNRRLLQQHTTASEVIPLLQSPVLLVCLLLPVAFPVPPPDHPTQLSLAPVHQHEPACTHDMPKTIKPIEVKS